AGKQFQRASVGGGGVEEKGEGKPNPALEVKIQKGEVTFREILFERFPQFSLHNEGVEGIRLSLESPLAELEAKNLIPDEDPHSGGVPQMGAASGEMPNDEMHSGKVLGGSGAKNEVIFRPDPAGGLHVKLKKDGKTVLEKLLAKSETVETPWMGMKLTAQDILRNAVEEADVRAVTPTPRQDLPPSAVLVELENGFPQLPFYLVEGEAKDVRIRDRNYTVYFGRKVIELPFHISLKKFSKVDYPGTQTAMSFESDVEVNDNGTPIKISMNEPLKEDKYTLYQASYQIGNGQPTASIFSVNHDPGRAAKYLGSLIAALGIIIYTFMKSRLARTAKVPK
ncbi:MAG: cytochrome c biogenesis protein ResB, partial [Bdellovibrionales bacterium]|nr:cytochrome c biogenesis protein ResB [Bdellovibrionales bacterium]